MTQVVPFHKEAGSGPTVSRNNCPLDAGAGCPPSAVAINKASAPIAQTMISSRVLIFIGSIVSLGSGKLLRDRCDPDAPRAPASGPPAQHRTLG